MFTMYPPGYILLALACMGLSLLASGYVRLRFSRGQQVALRSGYTGAEVARLIMEDQGLTDVTVVEHQGFLSDHYNPMQKTLNLSSEVYNGVNAAAAGVAAHECGHALQHQQGDLTMWGRTVLVYPAMIGQNLAPLLIMIGVGLGFVHGHASGPLAQWLVWGGILAFAIATVCSVIIVFNEFNASARARAVLMRLHIVAGADEEDTVSGVLTAAGLTYLAAAVTSIATLIYWLMQSGILGGQRED